MDAAIVLLTTLLSDRTHTEQKQASNYRLHINPECYRLFLTVSLFTHKLNRTDLSYTRNCIDNDV